MADGDKMHEERVNGGCEGPDAMFVKLISSDGHEFIIKREHALTSGTIKAMLSGPGQFAENETNEVHFREIPSHVLQKVCQYFTYKTVDPVVASTATDPKRTPPVASLSNMSAFWSKRKHRLQLYSNLASSNKLA